MALINCPECAKEISDRSTACPHCGLPSELYSSKYADVADNETRYKENLLEKGAYPSDPSTLQDLNADELRNALISFDRDYVSLFSKESYIESSRENKFRERYEEYYKLFENNLVSQYLKTNLSALKIDEISMTQFTTKMRHLKTNIDSHNETYVESNLIKYKDYFDHILDDVDPTVKLDIEQRQAVITDDNHCLLVAGAGAGKTTTMAAKVKYLVDKQNVSPEDIIVISYTNKAVNELKDRINKRLKIPIKVATFHSFAFDIVKQAQDETPEINFSSYNIIFDMLAKSIFDNKKLMRNLVLFMGYYFDLPDDIFEFKSLNEYHMYRSAIDFETLKSGLREYVSKVAMKRSNSVRTITGEFLRSIQEVQIANFLYLNGIEYEYERSYPKPIIGARKKYTPDFFIVQGENRAYIEHYSLSDEMRSHIFDPQQMVKYKKSIQDKRNLHKRNSTKLVETWSSYKDKRPLRDHLEEALNKAGFVLKPRNLEEVYRKIVETGKDKYIYKLVWLSMRFIEQFKTAGYSSKGLDVLRKSTDNVRNRLFLDIMEEVYLHYQETLQQKNQIDFADMINDAESLLFQMQQQGTTLPYKYIVIDEFQDIARQRFNLTKRLSEITHAKVIAVGDDWQSIFAFAGSDISLFTRFIQLMGSGKEMKITHTYRNSQELIDIAGGFIQKNSIQIKKRLLSPKHLEDPIQLEFYDDSTQTYKNLAVAVNKSIGNIISEFGINSSILLICRYNFDLNKLEMTGEFKELYNNKVRSKKFPKANIQYLTAHSSKGLGYDNVIILNMVESMYGFPSQIETDPIIKMVTYEENSIPFAEERRLFYVALTRTKNRVYIASPLNKPSRFLIELIKEYKLPHPSELNIEFTDTFVLRCPECKFPLRYEFNKNYGLGLYMCTNEFEVCDFMTNDRKALRDIFKCPDCIDGYMIIKRNKKDLGAFYGCTNYGDSDSACRNIVRFN